jgi:hypothetical protein
MRWLALMFLLGCAQVSSLNLKKHQFGIQPMKIIWFQVAGLEEDQIAMLRFSQTAGMKTSFENNTCIGKSWNYNLYNLRSSAYSTFLSQLTGKKNIQLTCEDASLSPIWSYLSGNGYRSGVLEIAADAENSLLRLGNCEGSKFLDSTFMWLRQEPPKDAETFIYSQQIPLKPNRFFYDRTCKGMNCDSSITEDVKAISFRLEKSSGKYLFIVRDFSYLAALEKKEMLKARGILTDLEHAYDYALDFTKKSDEYLVILTSGDSKFVEMPEMGKAWAEFEKNGSGAVVKRTKLTNLVLASGVRAENFCGIYEDAQVFDRIMSGPEQQGLEYKIINPFK